MSSEEVIGGYRVRGVMSTGQTSQVLEVVENSSNRHFAMKLLLPEKVRSQEHTRYLFHEAEVGMKLQHPNVIRIFKLVKSKTNPFIIMEYFPGKNLGLRLRTKDPLVQEKAHSIIEQAAKGIAFIHDKGWVHRDIKPDNILLNASAEVRVIDFALATRAQKDNWWTRLFKKRTTTQGTRSYMSPEQIQALPVDSRADIYSFGATIYELISGRPPFRGASPGDLLQKHLREKPVSPKQFNPKITDQCADLILSMLEKKKENRMKDLHEFLIAFRNVRVFEGDVLERTYM